MLVLFDVIAAVWVGAFVGALMKVASPHPNWVSWMVSALVGALGAVFGLFVARFVGVGREDNVRTLLVAGVLAIVTMCGYILVSRIVVRQLDRTSRPTIAF